MRKRVLLAWSSGKDSAWSLHLLRARQDLEVAGLFTTVHDDTQRVAVHAVRDNLLVAQAESLGLPLKRIAIPHPCPNEAYAAAMDGMIAAAKSEGITHLAFGDLFLEDIRAYRERLFAASGLGLLFPLWGMPTRALAEEMTAAGLRAYLTCIDPVRVPRAWAGQLFDPAFVARVPEGIDPCGERGEFHTFAFDGPMFGAALDVRPGEITERGGFVYADLLAGGARGR